MLTRKIMLESDLIFAPGGWTLWLALSLFSLSLPSRQKKKTLKQGHTHKMWEMNATTGRENGKENMKKECSNVVHFGPFTAMFFCPN